MVKCARTLIFLLLLHSYKDNRNELYNKLILIRHHSLVYIANTVRCTVCICDNKMPVCSFWYFCIYAPRLDVSLIKKYHDLQICTRPTCRSILGNGFRKKNIFQPEVFFFEFINSIYIFQKKELNLEVNHFRYDFFFEYSDR